MYPLNELLSLNHSNRMNRDQKTNISEIYGIIYRIYCIPEKKSYIGQTFSHTISGEYYQRHGILTRCKIHDRTKTYETSKIRPLYQALNKYSYDQFEVYEELKIYGKDLARINQIEGEYMKKYNSVCPNGYNIDDSGKKYGELYNKLAEYHKFEIERTEYKDTTREERRKDVCFGIRFGLERSPKYPEETILKHLKSINILSIRLMNSKGLRIIVKEKDTKDNIRLYFGGTREECMIFAKKISDNIIVSESFKGLDTYKYQNKLDKIIDQAEICTKIRGKEYKIVNNKGSVYNVAFYGRINNKIQILLTITFGGKNIKIENSKEEAWKFVMKFLKSTDTEIPFTLPGIW